MERDAGADPPRGATATATVPRHILFFDQKCTQHRARMRSEGTTLQDDHLLVTIKNTDKYKRKVIGQSFASTDKRLAHEMSSILFLWAIYDDTVKMKGALVKMFTGRRAARAGGASSRPLAAVRGRHTTLCDATPWCSYRATCTMHQLAK